MGNTKRNENCSISVNCEALQMLIIIAVIRERVGRTECEEKNYAVKRRTCKLLAWYVLNFAFIWVFVASAFHFPPLAKSIFRFLHIPYCTVHSPLSCFTKNTWMFEPIKTPLPSPTFCFIRYRLPLPLSPLFPHYFGLSFMSTFNCQHSQASIQLSKLLPDSFSRCRFQTTSPIKRKNIYIPPSIPFHVSRPIIFLHKHLP